MIGSQTIVLYNNATMHKVTILCWLPCFLHPSFTILLSSFVLSILAKSNSPRTLQRTIVNVAIKYEIEVTKRERDPSPFIQTATEPSVLLGRKHPNKYAHPDNDRYRQIMIQSIMGRQCVVACSFLGRDPRSEQDISLRLEHDTAFEHV
ncbi:hypothetical protein EYC84_008356 [Monilinia fructicola]|uniref:Uncharacterized protein n=1 Tax=Monilinia fructicola TaxID=38448 RepID=A0A5M9JJA8_MONFR|nr:hypothetical protein EYC84_008356 [Monilinia fructicola]